MGLGQGVSPRTFPFRHLSQSVEEDSDPTEKEDWHVARFMRMTAGLFSVVLALALAIVPAFAQSGGEKQLVIALTRDADNLDPAMTTQLESYQLIINIFDRLVELDENLQFQPGLAERWEAEGTVWRFYLRQGVTATNGEPMDAHAVKFTFDRIMDPETRSPQATRLAAFKEVRVVDDYTVEIETHQPYAPMLHILAAQWIVPPKAVQEMGVQFGNRPIGSGPYILEEWQQGQQAVLRANPNYWKGKPAIDRVIFRPISEASTRVSALMTGEVDIAAAIPPERLEELRRHPDIDLKAKTGTMLYLGLQSLEPPFDKREVRQAINYAIDVDLIIDAILEGSAVPMHGAIFEGGIGYDPELKPYPYDPEKAKELLAQAGYPNGFETELFTPPGGVEGTSNTLEVAEAIAFMLGQVGIDVKIQLLDPATQHQRYANREFKMYLYTWPFQPEPDRYLWTLFHSKARGYYYQNPEADRILEEGQRVLDPAARHEVYKQLDRFLHEDAPWGFLYTQLTYYGVRKGVQWEAPADTYIQVILADKN